MFGQSENKVKRDSSSYYLHFNCKLHHCTRRGNKNVPPLPPFAPPFGAELGSLHENGSPCGEASAGRRVKPTRRADEGEGSFISVGAWRGRTDIVSQRPRSEKGRDVLSKKKNLLMVRHTLLRFSRRLRLKRIDGESETWLQPVSFCHLESTFLLLSWLHRPTGV